MNKILLDTNAYVNLCTGDGKVMEALSAAETVFVSAVTLGELYAGFEKTEKGHGKKHEFENFLSNPTVKIIDITKETAGIYGDLIRTLRKAGTPVPINDVWIAANAIETGSVIVTYDRHFLKIAGLRIWDQL
ncbi:MAG TPA: twitching motility protein PilT [Lentisphaeria bacterium]|nr:MAG: twitching motility protein PilT [Lentisphaerae bacterium GWF2_49_21]HBC86795.1 twitching motility protein PilT [Lentisphaeria bacterium]